MVAKKRKATPEKKTSRMPPKRKALTRAKKVSSRPADSDPPAASSQRPAGASQRPTVPIGHKRLSILQKIFIVSIVVIAAMLLYALVSRRVGSLLKSPSRAVTALTSTPTVQRTPSPKPPVDDSTQAAQKQIQKPKPVPPPEQPLSLKVAQNFYLEGDYDKAYAVYNKLRQSLPASVEEELLRDFLQLKMALCMEKAGDIEQASRLLRKVSKSRSPVVRVVANYHRSLIEMQKKQYLNVRTRTYQTIALIDAVDFNKDWVLSLQRDCCFLAAESTTRSILSLCDADKDLPDDLWSNSLGRIDPFTNLSEAQLRSLLNSGSEQLSKGLLSPQIQKLEDAGSPPRWSVICHGAPIEELLARFATNAGLDIHWTFSKAAALEGAHALWEPTKDAIRKRPVSLYLPAATIQQFVTVAAGHVGLLAQLDEKGILNIFNPADYYSLSEHISLLIQEAVSLWQKFVLKFHDDERIPNAHFALGLLQAQKGRVAESIAEYKLVANRYPQASLAPFALLHSSELKTSLRDYSGARQDLRQLVEQYPDTEIVGQAYLYLADATMKAQLKTEAERLYRKIYNLDLSLDSQMAAALGAAKCFHERKDHQAAAKWLTRYIRLVKDRTSPSTLLGTGNELYSAYFLLGKTYLALGKSEAACEALQHALSGRLSREEYVGTLSALVEGYIQQEHFVQALNLFENTHSVVSSQKESIEITLLKSRVLRTMGLVDKAIEAIGDKAEYISDPQLKAKISLELTDCYIAKGNLERARRELTEILVTVEPGPLAHEITIELADVCLKLGQNSQVISVCSQLLGLEPSEQIRQKALNILATTYKQQRNYDRAALVLLGQ